MITREDMGVKISKVCKEYTGNGQDLILIVGMVVVGQEFGWRVVRLIASRRLWTLACAIFGDLKELLPERGVLAYKSVGLVILDRAGRYWELIRGQDKMDGDQRKMLI
jgi:hypothetical protein